MVNRNSRRPSTNESPNSPAARKAAMSQRLRVKAAEKGPEKKICLTMIVRNEAKNMVRLLDSVKSIIDMISIVDTGSTDNTEEVIRNWGKEHQLPTTVHHEPFDSFSHNRTHSVKMAQETYPEADYLLLSDADFLWEINVGGTFRKNLLIDHEYKIEQYNKVIRYYNTRLLSAKVKWNCIGLTHEYWEEAEEFKGQVRKSEIRTLRINDLEDGGYKADKFIRDERLLRRGLAEDSRSHLQSRYTFYLAQTLRDVGRYPESIEYYTKRAEMGGWPEEVYYSMYQVGECHKRLVGIRKYTLELLAKDELKENEQAFMDKWYEKDAPAAKLIQERDHHFELAKQWFLKAYEFRPSRAEALRYLVELLRIESKHQEAYELIQKGKLIPPTKDHLFVDIHAYTWAWDYEACIICYYLPAHKEEGAAACERLLSRDDLPAHIHETVERNSRHYL